MARFVLTAQLQLQAPNNVSQIVSQIQNQLNGINVNVQVQGSARAQQQIQQITQSTNQATSAADRMGRAFAVSIRRFAAFSIATRAVGLFTSTLSDAIQTSIDFERQLVKVAQVTGKSVGGLRDLTDEITNLARGFGVSSQSLLEVTTILTQAGLSASDTKVALNSLAQAALAPNFDSITQTAEGAIAILAQFQQGVGALESQLGSINAVAGAFAVEASDLIDVIRRTGGVFKSSGGDLNELLALFTSVRATTRESAESIGTGLRTIFTRIQRPETIEFLKQFGVNLLDLEGKFVGPFEAVKRLSGALGGLGERDITFIKVAEELGGFRQIGKVLPLLQQFSTAEAALNVATKANNSLSQDAASAQAALAVRIAKVREEFLALIRSITETSTFQIMANTALTLASALIKIADSIKPLLPLLASVAAFRAIRGIGTFVGSTVAGLQSGRTFNKGGKVHHFATGGLVPGVGNTDTVPAMLSPGEFVIRKSSVEKLGASNLAGMNRGGEVQKFAFGGQARKFGIAALEGSKLDSPQSNIPIENIIAKLGFNGNKKDLQGLKTTIRGILGLKGQTGVPVSVQSDLLTFNDPSIKESIYNNLKNQVYGLVTSTADSIGQATGIPPNRKNPINPNKILNKIGTDSTMGSVFEGALAILGGPFATSKSTSAIDFPRGLGRFASAFSTLNNIPVDAKRTSDTKKISEMISTKIPNYFADFVSRSQLYKNFKSVSSQNRINQLQGKEFDIEEYRKFSGNSRIKLQELSELATPSRKIGNRQLFTLKGFATGGGVGTDTVPALLTPGEFVVNRSSAQSIGYGNLNRMNKIGKYANGGIVQRFNQGTGAAGVKAPAMLKGSSGFATFEALTKQAILLAKAQQVHINATNAATQSQNQNTEAQQRNSQSALQAASNNKMFAASMAVSLLQGFLPAVDENSSMLLKFSTSLLGIVSTLTTVGFALEAFGINLTLAELTSLDKMANRLGLVFDSVGRIGTGLVDSFRNMISTQASSAAASTASATADTAEAAASTTAAASSLGKSLGGFAIGATVAYLAVKTFSDAVRKSAEDLNKKKIEAGDVEGARQAGENLGSVDFAEVLQNYGAIAGTVVGGFAGGTAGSVVPLAGTAAGVAIGSAGGGIAGGAIGRGVGNFVNAFGPGDADKAMGSVSASAAQFVKTNKILENSSDKAAKALENVQAGTMSLREALDSLSVETQSSVDAMKLAQQANAAEEKVASKQTTGFGRDFLATITLGYRDSNAEVQARKNSVAERTRESQRVGQQQLRTLQPMMQQQMRTTAITGGDFDSFLDSLSTTEFELLNMTEDGVKNAYQSFVNISKEIEISRKALEAMNLGLRGPTSTATAMSASMDRFVAGLEVGGNTFVANAQFLSEAMTGAAQAMDPDQIKSAMGNVRDNLEKMGISQKYLDKFETNTNAFVQAQQNYNKAFNNVRANIQSQREKGLSPDISPDAIKKAFAKELTTGLGEDAKKNLTAIINNIKLDPEEVDKILSGDLSVFGDKLTEAGKKQFEEIIKIAQERQKAEQVLIDLTKKRIEAERNALEAQKEALSLALEGRELQSKYGGKVVTNEERRKNILDRANVNSSGSGLSNMNTGNLADIRRRNKEIEDRSTAIEDSRREQNGMEGVSGARMNEMQQDLKKAQKDQVNTIRELIKLEEENLKLIGEKNKLEKDSIDALVSGDIDKFMQTQATIGATAAIATGNKSLMGAFGPEALGLAAQDIRRQQEAGVPSLYGTQLAGQGGLTQQAYGSAISARGVTDPRLAQVASGTTAEEEASKSRLRDLGTALIETGQIGVEMANMELESATINVTTATIELTEIDKRGQAAGEALAKANGGLIYANRGMFIPRGTDTVPAMLTPGEFVVRREAVNRGNNLQILQQMNGAGGGMANSSAVMGFARGGRVQYYAEGGVSSSSGSGESFEKLTQALTRVMSYVNGVAESIKSLPTTISHQIADTKIDVNVMGGNMLNSFAENLESRVMGKVSEKLKNSYPTENGIQNNGSVLG
jgi:TP901 family phage tail tape measure protein